VQSAEATEVGGARVCSYVVVSELHSDHTGRSCMLQRSLLKQGGLQQACVQSFSGGKCLGVSSCRMLWTL